MWISCYHLHATLNSFKIEFPEHNVSHFPSSLNFEVVTFAAESQKHIIIYEKGESHVECMKIITVNLPYL